MKSLYILFAGFSIFLLSCSSSYRTVQTTDDVYYSPAMNNGNTNSYSKSSNDDDGDYVSVQGDDENSYGYRNDVQEDWYIRRGISNPFYRNSFSLSLGYGGYNSYYDPFYSPFFPSFNPISYYGYAGMWDPYYFNNSWLSHTRYPYGYGLTHPFGNYSPYYVPYGNFSYGYFNSYPNPVRRDNGPRVLNLNSLRTGISTPIRGQNNPDRPTLAPIRTMRNGNIQNGTIERRVTPRNNNSSTSPANNNRNVRKFKNNSRNNDYYSPSPSQNRRSAPARNNNVSPAPNRTFERTSPAPSRSVERTPSTPPSNNGGGSKSAPVRKF